jgi:hypothetical protein
MSQSVNHCNHPNLFRTRYASLSVKIQQKLSIASREWPTGDKDLFYEQAILRAEKLLETLIIPLSNLDEYKHHHEIPRLFTAFELIAPPHPYSFKRRSVAPEEEVILFW